MHGLMTICHEAGTGESIASHRPDRERGVFVPDKQAIPAPGRDLCRVTFEMLKHDRDYEIRDEHMRGNLYFS